MRSLEVKLVSVAKLKRYPQNARTHSKAQIRQIADSIKEFGWTNPLLVRNKVHVLAGHARLDAAELLKIKQVPCIAIDGLTEPQYRALIIADNQLALNAGWDVDILRSEIQALKAEDFDIDVLGFEDSELKKLVVFQASEGQTDPDELPEPPAEPITQPGDLWILGEHRLLCGDSTKAQDVEYLLDGGAPFLMVTDPPYGVQLDGEWRDRAGFNGLGPAEPNYMRSRDGQSGHRNASISLDTRVEWSEAFELVPSLQVAYVWHASVYTREVLTGLERIGFLYPQQIIWDKGIAVLTRTHYWFSHEPAWYVRKKNAPWRGKAGQPTIWKAASPKFLMGGSTEEKFDHPTQKPVELMEISIGNHTKRGELVYEPFGGSGTTLMAAERLERVCLAIELEPKYCDVIVKRWEAFTGKKAQRQAAAVPA